MHGLGLIQTKCQDGPANGLGAMVGAWWCGDEASKIRSAAIRRAAGMQNIQHYNEVNCKVMMEIIKYLREKH